MLKFLRDEAGLKQEQAAKLLDKRLAERSRWGSVHAIRTAISQFETNSRKVPHLYRVAFSEVYRFPLDWFTRPWRSEKSFAAALKRHRAAGSAPRAPTLAQIASTFSGAVFVDALPQADADHYSSSRKALFERFRNDLQASRPAVLVVEGVSGYGKSSFVSLAIQHLVRANERYLIVAVKCMERTADQIVREITDHVRTADPGLNLEAPERFFHHVPTIIVLDDADKIAGQTEQGGAPIAGARLAELFASAMQSRCNLKVVVTMRTSSGPAAGLFEEISLLADRTQLKPYHLAPLTTEDVAAVIRKKLRYEIDTSTRFAKLIGGDPIVLSSFVAISSEERRGRTIPWLEMVASNLAERPPEFEERATEMLPLLEALGQRSPTALLTAAILTCSLGAIDQSRCQQLVDLLLADGVLPESPHEVADDTVRSVLVGVLDDFTTTDSSQTELHSRVKATFRALLAERLAPPTLRQIHRRMAECALEPAALVAESRPTPLGFGSYVAILHHLIAIYWLAPSTKSAEFVLRHKAQADSPSESDSKELEALLNSDERLLDRSDIANVAYGALMLSSVDTGPGTRVVSRQYGDYERKLKMLAMFTQDGLKEKSDLVPLPELAQPYIVQLLLDIAVCANQSGLLEVAREAIRARPRFEEERAQDHLQKIRQLLEAGVDDEDADLGRLIHEYNADSEFLNINAAVLMREGNFDEAIGAVKQHTHDAHELVTVVRKRREGVEHLRRRSRLPLATLLVACRRLLAKSSHLYVLRGDSAEATKWFGLALHSDSLRHRTGLHLEQEAFTLFPDQSNTLPGEAGRAYCCMLMHGGSPQALDAVSEVIAASIEKTTTLGRLYEQIDWLVLRASLERLRGQPNVAARTLREAQALRRRHSVNISFQSSIILSTEEERQRVRGRCARGNSPRLQQLYKIAASADHSLLACDAALLLAEFSPNSEQRHQWMTLARRTIVQGYGFRSLDLQRLEADGPFADLL